MSGSIARHPLTWKPPMATCTPARRSGAAMSTARGNWFDCTPTSATRPWPPRARIRSAMRSGRTRVLVSSMASMTRSTSSPSTARAAQSSAKPLSTASVLDGMAERSHWMT